MTTAPRSVEHRITALMTDPDLFRPGNPIHSTDAAREYGYEGALVGGVTIYAWTIPTILEALGERWLSDGWVDVMFRRPTYPNQQMTIRVTEGEDGISDLAMTNDEGATAVSGQVGLGKAPWLDDLQLPVRRAPEPKLASVSRLTLAEAPVGQDLRPMSVPVTAEDVRKWASGDVAVTDPRFTEGDRPLLHPGWIAARMESLAHHSYDYSPAIHTRSQVQHLAPARADQTLTAAGRMSSAYERKGHHYYEMDAMLFAEHGEELARFRHTSIFQVAKRA